MDSIRRIFEFLANFYEKRHFRVIVKNQSFDPALHLERRRKARYYRFKWEANYIQSVPHTGVTPNLEKSSTPPILTSTEHP